MHPVGRTLSLSNLLALTEGPGKESLVLNDGPVRKPSLFMSWENIFTQNGIYLHPINNQVLKFGAEHGGLGMTSVAGMLDGKGRNDPIRLDYVPNVQAF